MKKKILHLCEENSSGQSIFSCSLLFSILRESSFFCSVFQLKNKVSLPTVLIFQLQKPQNVWEVIYTHITKELMSRYWERERESGTHFFLRALLMFPFIHFIGSKINTWQTPNLSNCELDWQAKNCRPLFPPQHFNYSIGCLGRCFGDWGGGPTWSGHSRGSCCWLDSRKSLLDRQ